MSRIHFTQNGLAQCALAFALTTSLAAIPFNAQAAVVFQENFDGSLGQFTSVGSVTVTTSGARMAGSFSGTDGAITSPAISTVGFTALQLSYTRTTTGLDSGEAGVLEYSTNGTTYVELGRTQSASGPVTVSLPAAAENQAALRLRWRVIASLSTEYYTVDTILLEGTGGCEPNCPPPPPPPPPPSCTAKTGTPSCTNVLPGQFSCSIAGRTYRLFVPQSYGNGTTAVPLVIDMHGYTSTASAQQSTSGWDDLAATENFIVAYPQGLSNSWNAQGQCCGSSTANDVQFIRDVVAQIRNNSCVRPDRIYATGLSNGGSMTHTLACDAADLFAGAAPVSFPLSGSGGYSGIVAACNPSRGIPVMHFHGRSDGTVSYNSGVLDGLGAQDSRRAWAEIQSCSTTIASTTPVSGTLCETHSNCMGGAKTALCSVTGGGHVLYPDVGSPGIPGLVWQFFKSFWTP